MNASYYAPKLKTIEDAFARLQMVARRKKNNGVLPSYTWLNANGYFYDYEMVRGAGWLKFFKRAFRIKQAR
jgi:hypothetical protein